MSNEAGINRRPLPLQLVARRRTDETSADRVGSRFPGAACRRASEFGGRPPFAHQPDWAAFPELSGPAQYPWPTFLVGTGVAIQSLTPWPFHYGLCWRTTSKLEESQVGSAIRCGLFRGFQPLTVQIVEPQARPLATPLLAKTWARLEPACAAGVLVHREEDLRRDEHGTPGL